eukprot:jgi/Chrzof1/8968/Cz03g31100.t1
MMRKPVLVMLLLVAMLIVMSLSWNATILNQHRRHAISSGYWFWMGKTSQSSLTNASAPAGQQQSKRHTQGRNESVMADPLGSKHAPHRRCHAGARAAIGYLANSTVGLKEFNHIAYASWVHIHNTSLATTNRTDKFDLVVFIEPAVLRNKEQIPAGCLTLDVLNMPTIDARRALISTPQCIMIPYPPTNSTEYFGYPYANSFHYLLDPIIMRFVSRYSQLIRTDFDVFFAPSLLSYKPQGFVTGAGAYIGPHTAHRLQQLAQKLKLRHKGIHNIGSTWIGDPHTMHKVAKLAMSLMRHILANEFEQKPEGGLIHMLDTYGWPEWYAGVASMYAAELAVNHLLDNVTLLNDPVKLDADSTSENPLTSIYTIHCWHTQWEFSKFEFFTHNYASVDLRGRDLSRIRQYCMYIAVQSYRQRLWQEPLPWSPGMPWCQQQAAGVV